jgi:hypothetical protein
MSTAVNRLEQDLRTVFGTRLRSLVTYGERTRAVRHSHDNQHSRGKVKHADDVPGVQTLAIVETLTGDDLRGCASRVAAWRDAGLATPLILAATEFDRSLDAFPLEFGAILADHTVIAGANPFEQLTVHAADVRRAVEVQARSHLLHLREGYLETLGRGDALAVLLVRSAPAFAALMTSVARLEGHDTHDPAVAARHAEQLLGIDRGIVTEIVNLAGVQKIPPAKADDLFPHYLDAVQRLVQYVDRWGAR